MPKKTPAQGSRGDKQYAASLKGHQASRVKSALSFLAKHVRNGHTGPTHLH